MLYILSEDKGSGKQLWDEIRVNILNKKAYLRSVDGVPNFPSKYNELRAKGLINKGDFLFIAIDTVESPEVTNTLTFFRNESARVGFKFDASKYYCIEETFLSFDKFAEFVGLSDPVKIAYYKKVYDCITKKCRDNYFDYKDIVNWIPNGGREHRERPTTKEQMAAKLLSIFTEGINPSERVRLQVHKGNIGYCWFCNCFDRHENACKKSNCILYETDNKLSRYEKVRSFCVHTIIKDTCPLKDLRKAAGVSNG